ncbi:MAG: beta-lactamase family protein [Dinghuibacter sp.]|nr:beta-lactamase family protein [Dinghuibacter sp.]
MSTITISQVHDAISACSSAAVNKGATIGVAVGAVLNNETATACSGVCNYSTQQAVATNTIFQIGSVTKIFTSAYFGQLVSAGNFSSNQTLGSFSGGALPGLTNNSALANATLIDVATFAVGLPSTPPAKVTGYPRPTIAEWGVADFTTWFAGLSPQNKYIYSDICTGIIGLLSTNADPTTTALPSDAVNNWLSAMEDNILTPLGMTDTLLQGISTISPGQQARLASGYQQALAYAAISNGAVSGITVINSGQAYITAPAVSIVSENGGTGATATAAAPDKEGIYSITVTNGGSGYNNNTSVVVAPGNSSNNNIPVWAAAGGFSSTVDDLLVMVQQCLLAYNSSAKSGTLSAGLNMSMQTYGQISPNLGYGMAWEINSASSLYGPVIFKPGGLPGFSSYLCILPQQNMGFVVLCNSRQSNPITRPAGDIVQSVLKSLFSA